MGRRRQRERLLAPIRSSEAFEGGHILQGKEIATGGDLPELPDQSARSAAEACAELEEQRVEAAAK